MLRSKRSLLMGLLVVLALTAVPALAQEAAARAPGLSGQSLRPYQFVFVAYALAWLLVFGWVVAVARRLARLDRRLGG